MSKIVIILAFGFFCLLQVQANRRTCERLTRVCEANQARVGSEDDVTNYLNADCRRRHPNWRNVNRCQMERAACELSMVSCGELTCSNINLVLRR